MTRNWHWEEVPFIPSKVVAKDMLHLPGHIFVKSNVVTRLKKMGEFRKKNYGKNHEKKRGRRKKNNGGDYGI